MDTSEHPFTGLGTMYHQRAQQGAGYQWTQNMYFSGSRALPEREKN